jgi:hypothetical protein
MGFMWALCMRDLSAVAEADPAGAPFDPGGDGGRLALRDASMPFKNNFVKLL